MTRPISLKGMRPLSGGIWNSYLHTTQESLYWITDTEMPGQFWQGRRRFMAEGVRLC